MKILKRLLGKAYLIGMYEAQKTLEEYRKRELAGKALIGDNTIIDKEAIIQNATSDRSKIGIGKNCFIRGYLLVFNHGGQITIGNDSFVGPDTRIWSAKNIYIGNRVLISHNVNIHDNNSHPLNSKERHEDFVHMLNKGLRYQNDLHEKEIIIEDDVWIGFNSTIFKGVKIGQGAIIGSCTLVKEDIPPNAVYAGTPGRILKYVD